MVKSPPASFPINITQELNSHQDHNPALTILCSRAQH